MLCVLDSEPPSVDRVAVAEAKCELSILFTARFEATAELVPRDAAYSELPWPSSRVEGFVAARAVPARAAPPWVALPRVAMAGGWPGLERDTLPTVVPLDAIRLAANR